MGMRKPMIFFYLLLNITNTLNHLLDVEYVGNGTKFN